MTEPTDRLAGALTKLAGRLPETAHELTRIARGLARGLADVSNSLAGALAHVSDGLPSALADISNSLAGALADLADRLASAFPDVADGLARALADLVDCVANSLTDLGKSFARALADVLDRLTGLADHVTGASADVLDRLTEAMDQLGIAVDRGHHSIDDRRHVVEANLEQRLCLDPLDVDLELAEADVDSDVEADEVEHLRLERDVRFELRKLEVDLVDLEHRDVEQHVRVLARLGQRGGGVVAVLLLCDGGATLDVLGEAVLLGLLRGGPRIGARGHRLSVRARAIAARRTAA